MARIGLVLAFVALGLAMLDGVIMRGGQAASPLAGSIHAAHASGSSGMHHAGLVSGSHDTAALDCHSCPSDDAETARLPQGAPCCPLACVALLPGAVAPAAGPVMILANALVVENAVEGWGSPPEPPTPPPRPA
jgi:hypothetical protein